MFESLDVFMAGAIFMGYATAGLFFLRFWRRTHDHLFWRFAIAFWVLAVLRVGLTHYSDEKEIRTFLFLARLLAFLLILWAIVQKNLETKKT